MVFAWMFHVCGATASLYECKVFLGLSVKIENKYVAARCLCIQKSILNQMEI